MTHHEYYIWCVIFSVSPCVLTCKNWKLACIEKWKAQNGFQHIHISFILFLFCLACASLVSLTNHFPIQLPPGQTNILSVTMGQQHSKPSWGWLDGWIANKASEDSVNHDYEIDTIEHFQERFLAVTVAVGHAFPPKLYNKEKKQGTVGLLA